ncbi:hypothetical protein [Methylobacterium sp. Gmos1]
MPKITLLYDRCWLIRSISPGPYRKGEPSFWVAGRQWNASPMHATIFPSEAAAQEQIDDARHYKRAGFGPNTVVEPVPLEGAVKTLGTEISDVE